MADEKTGWKSGDDEDEGDQEIDETIYKAQKDAIILAIEISESMLKAPAPSSSKKADNDSPVQAALKCAYHLMQQRIISNPKDMMGILLFGTEKSRFQEDNNDRMGYPQCFLFTDLGVPAAEDVRALKALAEDGEDELDVLEPSSDTVSMASVLFCVNQIFTTKAANFGSRRLFIITNNDNPHPSDSKARSAAAVRAKDLYDLGVTIELFPITNESTKFAHDKFYDDIIYNDEFGEANASEIRSCKTGDGLTLLNSLISNINSKQVAKRALFSNLPFEIAPGLRISVKGYNIVHRQKPARTCYIWLDGDRPQIVSAETTRIEDDSTRTVEMGEMKRAYKFGGEYVYFKPEEQKNLRDFGLPIIRIIGFKPRDALPVWASVKKATFIFPSEEDFVGSTRVYAALWKKLTDSNKMGLAWCLPRTNSQPFLGAIVPSRGSSDHECGTPYLPSGLWIYPLPFVDDLREIKQPGDLVKSSDELKNRMRTVVQQLHLPKGIYNPINYPNPSLQWHYKILQALALEEEVPDQADDATMPKFKAIAKRAGGYLEEWSEQLEEEATQARKVRAHKRSPDVELPERPVKRNRGSDEKPSSMAGKPLPGLDIIRAAVESGGIAKWTVVQLKEVLTAKGLSTSGKKMELIERVEQWVEES